MRIAVIIPTYNEAGRIGTLLEELKSVFSRFPAHEWNVVVVDANSPDGTGDIVRAASAGISNFHLIVEPEKRGIAMAYMAGIAHAVDSLGAEAFIEFDGDGQHDPRDIPRLVVELGKGADYVVGSRYVPGGSVPKEWAMYRKILSRFGSWYARMLLRLPVRDVTSGLKATRISAWQPLHPEELLSRDYAYKIQFLQRMHAGGARIVEIPIVFRLREHDISKSTLKDILDSLKVTAILRFRPFLHQKK